MSDRGGFTARSRVPSTWTTDGVTGFPKNAEFDVVRRLPGEDGRCDYVAVVAVAGPNAKQAFVAKPEWLSATRAAEPSADEVNKKQEERRQAAAAILDEELKTGRCDQKHVDQLRKLLEGTKQLFSQTPSRGSSDVWDLVTHKLMVATEKPGEFTLDTGVGGEVHVFALGFAPTKLAIKDAQGYGVTNRSPYADALVEMFHLKTVGLQVQANTGDQLKSAVYGRGCVLVFAMHKL